jgi:hypothetical protein
LLRFFRDLRRLFSGRPYLIIYRRPRATSASLLLTPRYFSLLDIMGFPLCLGDMNRTQFRDRSDLVISQANMRLGSLAL